MGSVVQLRSSIDELLDFVHAFDRCLSVRNGCCVRRVDKAWVLPNESIDHLVRVAFSNYVGPCEGAVHAFETIFKRTLVLIDVGVDGTRQMSGASKEPQERSAGAQVDGRDRPPAKQYGSLCNTLV